MRNPRYLQLLILAMSVLLMPADRSLAVYSITNGGFDAQDASFNNNATVSPAGWFNASNAAQTFSDNILNVLSGSAGSISNAAGASAGAWDANGIALGRDAPFGNDGTLEQAYIYQAVGTYNGEASLGVTGLVYNRISTGSQNQPGNFDVAFYYTSGAFVPAVGVDVATAGTPIGTQQVFTQGVDFTITTGATAQKATWTHSANFAGSGITNGSTVWLRIGDHGNPDGLLFDEPVLDNINITGCGLGDVNCNGTADIATDLAAIRANFRKTVTTRAQGDLDGSGDVDMLDYLQWQHTFLGGGAGGVAPGLDVVPEPTGVLLAILGAAGVATLGRTRSKRKLAARVRLGISCMLATVGLLSSARPAAAIDNTWIPTGADNYNTQGNWSAGAVPDRNFGEIAVIDNGGTATLSAAAAAQPGGVVLGQTLGNTGTLTINAGGSLTVAAGVAPAAGLVSVGVNGGGTGTLNMTGGSLTAAQIITPNVAANTINLSGSAVVNTPNLVLGGTTRITGPNVSISSPNLVLQGPAVNLIAGITSAAQHSPLKSSGVATISGTLALDFNGVTPNFGDHWNVVDAQVVLGNFSNAGSVPVSVAGVPQAAISGEAYHVKRVPGGAFGQVLQVSRDKILAIQVDRDTGAVSLLNPQNGGIQIRSYLISSNVGSLKPANGFWNSFSDQSIPNWQESNPSANHIGETNPQIGGSFDFTGVASKSIGSAYDDGAAFATNGIGASSQDVAFSYSTTAGDVIQGQVQYVGTGKTNNLLLTINPSTGSATLKNDSPGTITIDSYSILSTSTALTPGGFNDSATANLTSASPTTSAISEIATNPNNPLIIGTGTPFNLGNIFNTASAQSGISLEFTVAGQNMTYNGVVRFATAVPGDYNGNGIVDGADYTIWRDTLGSTTDLRANGDNTLTSAGVVDAADFLYWKSRLNNTSGSGSGGISSGTVPEPGAWSLMLLGFVGILFAAGGRQRSCS